MEGEKNLAVKSNEERNNYLYYMVVVSGKWGKFMLK